jgi:cellobiose phosphorylase
MYRLVLESLLGLRLDANKLSIDPCLPLGWKAYKIRYRFRETIYHIDVVRMDDSKSQAFVTVDGLNQEDRSIPFINDLREHHVRVQLPPKI